MATATARARPIIVPVTVTVHLALAGGVVALRLAGTEPPLRAVEWPGSLVLGLAYGLPALFGLLALRGRPAALLAASASSLLLAAIPLAETSPPLLALAVLYAVAYARRPAPRPARRGLGPGLATLGLLATMTLAGMAAFWALFWPAQTTYSWSVTVDRGGHSSYHRQAEPSGQCASGQIEQDGGQLGAPGQGGTTSIEQGCSDGVIGLRQAGESLLVAAVALGAGLLLPRQPTPAPRPPTGTPR